MKRVRITMDMVVKDDYRDLMRALDHHVEQLIDTNGWPEIISIDNCTIEDLDTQDWSE